MFSQNKIQTFYLVLESVPIKSYKLMCNFLTSWNLVYGVKVYVKTKKIEFVNGVDSNIYKLSNTNILLIGKK